MVSPRQCVAVRRGSRQPLVKSRIRRPAQQRSGHQRSLLRGWALNLTGNCASITSFHLERFHIVCFPWLWAPRFAHCYLRTNNMSARQWLLKRFPRESYARTKGQRTAPAQPWSGGLVQRAGEGANCFGGFLGVADLCEFVLVGEDGLQRFLVFY
jgi:hypothetical protein